MLAFDITGKDLDPEGLMGTPAHPGAYPRSPCLESGPAEEGDVAPVGAAHLEDAGGRQPELEEAPEPVGAPLGQVEPRGVPDIGQPVVSGLALGPVLPAVEPLD